MSKKKDKTHKTTQKTAKFFVSAISVSRLAGFNETFTLSLRQQSRQSARWPVEADFWGQCDVDVSFKLNATFGRMRRKNKGAVFGSEDKAERISFLAGGTFSGQKKG